MTERSVAARGPAAAEDAADRARGRAAERERVVVVVPTLNEEATIADCLTSLIRDDPIAARCPVVVADGGSADATRRIVTELTARHANLRLMRNARRIQSAAVNLALDPVFADRTVLVRCDAHARYPRRYVSRLVAALVEREADSVVVPMDTRHSGSSALQRAVSWIVDTKLGCGGAAHRGGRRSAYVDHGHHAAMRMATFRRLRGYDESFRVNEDAEYDHRLRRIGGRIWLDADIRVEYYPRSSARALWRQYFAYGGGRAQTCLKHRTIPKARQLIPVAALFGCAGGLAAAPVWPVALAPPLAYALTLALASLWTASRRRAAAGLLAGPAAGIMHMAWALGFVTKVAGAALPVAGRRDGGAIC